MDDVGARQRIRVPDDDERDCAWALGEAGGSQELLGLRTARDVGTHQNAGDAGQVEKPPPRSRRGAARARSDPARDAAGKRQPVHEIGDDAFAEERQVLVLAPQVHGLVVLDAAKAPSRGVLRGERRIEAPQHPRALVRGLRGELIVDTVVALEPGEALFAIRKDELRIGANDQLLRAPRRRDHDHERRATRRYREDHRRPDREPGENRGGPGRTLPERERRETERQCCERQRQRSP